MSSIKKLKIKHVDIERSIEAALKSLDTGSIIISDEKSLSQVNYTCHVKTESALLTVHKNEDGTVTLVYGTGANPELSKKIALAVQDLAHEKDIELLGMDSIKVSDDQEKLKMRFPFAEKYFDVRFKRILNFALEDAVGHSDETLNINLLKSCANHYIVLLFKSKGVDVHPGFLFDLIAIEKGDMYIKLDYSILLNNQSTKDLIVKMYLLNMKLDSLLKNSSNRDQIYTENYKSFRTDYASMVCDLIEKIAISENNDLI